MPTKSSILPKLHFELGANCVQKMTNLKGFLATTSNDTHLHVKNLNPIILE